MDFCLGTRLSVLPPTVLRSASPEQRETCFTVRCRIPSGLRSWAQQRAARRLVERRRAPHVHKSSQEYVLLCVDSVVVGVWAGRLRGLEKNEVACNNTKLHATTRYCMQLVLVAISGA